jgi:hypothetical protein
MGVVNTTPRLISPWNEPRFPSYTRGVGPRLVWMGAENLTPPPGFEHRIVHRILTDYTNYTILVHVHGRDVFER